MIAEWSGQEQAHRRPESWGGAAWFPGGGQAGSGMSAARSTC